MKLLFIEMKTSSFCRDNWFGMGNQKFSFRYVKFELPVSRKVGKCLTTGSLGEKPCVSVCMCVCIPGISLLISFLGINDA